MDSGGQKGVPMLAPIAHQNHTSIDPNQVEFLKSFYGNPCLDPNKVHPSLLQTLREIEKDNPCKNDFLDNIISPNPNVRKDSSKSSCMKEDVDPMCNEGDGQGIDSIGVEGFANVSRHDFEDFKF